MSKPQITEEEIEALADELLDAAESAALSMRKKRGLKGLAKLPFEIDHRALMIEALRKSLTNETELA